MDENQKQELITGGLGLYSLGIGVIFALLPEVGNKLAGFNLAKGPESKLVIRILGMRDISLGAGLLLNRADPKTAGTWRRFLAFNAGTDALLFALTIPRSKNKASNILAVTASAAATVAALVL